ncbi:MAG: hypothetical protein HY321_03545 [Armatimonadetes bacterium]|nr:hypothetical protein [Armatimonadota bacterium]
MGNRLHIEPTEFRNLRTGRLSHGYVAWDDSVSDCETWDESVPEADLELFRKVLEHSSERLRDSIDAHLRVAGGLEIAGGWYGEEQLWPIVEDYYQEVDEGRHRPSVAEHA